MHDGHTPYEEAQRNWATAIQTYRFALAVYRRVLKTQHNRALLPSGQVQPQEPPKPTAPVLCGLAGLTPREREVAELIARGYTNQQIAQALVLTRGTVANHVAHILGKLALTNRTQIAARVLESVGQPTHFAPAREAQASAGVPIRSWARRRSRAVSGMLSVNGTTMSMAIDSEPKMTDSP